MVKLFLLLQKWLMSPPVLKAIEPIEKIIAPDAMSGLELVSATERMEKMLIDIQYSVAQLRGFVESKIVSSELVEQPPTLLLD